MTYKIVALLPMKANSERVKGKNFKILKDKPLFKWILNTLLSIKIIDKIVINTDARIILEENGLFTNERIVIRNRKKELIGDFVSMNSIISDDISNINSDIYLMTHTTNPFLSSKTIIDALDLFQHEKNLKAIDSLFTVNKFQSRFYNKDCDPINHNPNNLLRTQDLEPWYEENSNLYIFTKESFNSSNARIGKNPILFETPRFESFDIDNQDDWVLAELVAKYLK